MGAEGDLATVDPTLSPTEDTLASLKPTTSPTEDDLATPEPTSSPREDVLLPLEPRTRGKLTSSASEDQSNNTESIFSPIVESGETVASNGTSTVESISAGSNLNYALLSWFSVFTPVVWVLV